MHFQISTKLMWGIIKQILKQFHSHFFYSLYIHLDWVSIATFDLDMKG